MRELPMRLGLLMMTSSVVCPSGAHAQEPPSNVLVANLGMLQPGGVVGVRFQRDFDGHGHYWGAEIGLGYAYPLERAQPVRGAVFLGRRWGQWHALLLEGGLSIGDRTAVFNDGQVLYQEGPPGVRNAVAVHVAIGYERRFRGGLVLQLKGGLLSILGHGQCLANSDGALEPCGRDDGQKLRAWLPQPYTGISLGKAF